MKTSYLSMAVLLAIGFALTVHAQTTQRSSVIYVPKLKGQAKQRIDGATRGGVESPPPVVRVITPEETSVAATDQPTLYWSLDKPTKYHGDVLVKTLDDEPVFEQHFDEIKTAGLQELVLSKGSKRLERGKDYRFVVLISVQPTEPASDIESSGTIRYEPPSTDVAAKTIATAASVDRATAYARNGYFVDAVAALAKDGNADAKRALGDLLGQANLK